MQLTLQYLENSIQAAKEINGYFAIAVTVPNPTGDEDLTEIIVNQAPGLDAKLAYYKEAYTNDLIKKDFPAIRIKGFTHGNTALEVVKALGV